MFSFRFLFISLLMFNYGCVGIGASSLKVERNDYNVAIQKSDNQQLLLNLVRLKYRDTPFFLQVSSVTSQFTFTTNANADATLSPTAPTLWGIGAGVALEEKPTLTYSPLQGEKFIQSFLSNIALEDIFLLYKSGWSVERVFKLTFQKMGKLENASNASGPTPTYIPVYEDFSRAIELIRILQIQRVLDIEFTKRNNLSELILNISEDAKSSSELGELNTVLGLPSENTVFILTTGVLPKDPRYLKVETRSLLGMMYYLSHAVEASKEDKDEGYITITKAENGEEFDWNLMTGGLLRIHSQAEPPTKPAIVTNYNDRYFFIKKSDLESKSTFTLLTQIFSLQSGATKDTSPLLTLGVGN